MRLERPASTASPFAPSDGDAAVGRELLEAVIGSSLVLLFRVDAADMSLNYISPNVTSVLGYEADEVLGSPGFFLEKLHPQEREKLLASMAERLASRVPEGEDEVRILHKDGTYRWFQTSVTMRYDGADVAVVGYAVDVTERRLADVEPRTAETRYRRLVERIPAIVYEAEMGSEACWDFVSPQIERILGFTVEEWTADPALWRRQLHPEDRERVFEEERLAVESGSFFSEYRLIAKDGRVVWFLDDGEIIQRDGRPPLMRGLMYDITNRKEAEEALRTSEASLRESEERHRAVVETTPDGIAVHSDGLTRFVNSAGARMLGAASPEELVGRPTLGFVHPDFRGAVAERIRTMLEEGVPSPLLEERFVRLDGSEIDVEVVASPITFGGEAAVLVVFRDVTERKRIERALGEAEAKYRTLVERIPAIVYFAEFGEPGPWLYVSPQAESILGYSSEEWIADEALWMRHIHPDDLERVLEDERHSRDAGTPLACEYRMLARDGGVVWIRDEAEVVAEGSGEPAMLRGIMYDITGRKRVEEALRQSLILLQRTDDERRRLLARVVDAQEEERRRIADDIHDDSIQVVTAVGLRLASLERRLQDPAVRDSVSQLNETVTSAITRLRNLLFELRPRSLDQEGLAATLRMYLNQVSEQAGIAYGLENRLVAEPPPETRTALYRIAQEALMNVRKHAEATKVDVLLEAREHGYFIRVRDDGAGFDTGSVRSTNGHLGLAAMRERAEMAGGWCRIDSRPGAGTTVDLWLPDPS